MSRKYLIVPALIAMSVVAGSSGAAVTPRPALRVGDAWVVEGDSGTKSVRVPLELSSPAPDYVEVMAATQNGTATTADYTAVASKLVTFDAQADRGYVDVPIKGDALREGVETFTVKLSGASTIVDVADDTSTVRIGDNEQPISVSAGDVAVTEGNTGTKNLTFTVALSRALGSGQTAQIAYATRNVTAAATDYTAKSGTLTFSGAATTQTVAVPITADRTTEPNETFELTLAGTSTVAGVVDAAALGTIVNDDGTAGATPPPALRVDDASLVEPATADANLRYRVWLSAAATKATSVEILTDAAAGTAAAGVDYVAQTARRVTIAIGATQVLVDVPVHADTTFEAPEERVALTLRSPTNAVIADAQGIGTIVDEEGPLRAWVTDAAIDEGDSGDRVASPEVVVAAPLAAGRTFDFTYATEDGDAKAPSDYASAAGTSKLDAASGPQRALPISVHGDGAGEADERLGVRVSSTTPGIVVEDPVGNVTIGNDDIVPTPDAPPTITGDLYDTGTVGTSSGEWSGDQPITLSRQWERCTQAGVCSAIGGAADSSYVVGSADVGSALRVSVTATNPAGTATASSPLSTVVAPKPARGQAEKSAAVQALIRGSIFAGECSARCQALVDRELANTDPQTASEMADLRDALGLFGAREAPRSGAYASRAKARAAQAAEEPRHWMTRFGPRIGQIALMPFGRSVIKVRSQGSDWYWLWSTPSLGSTAVDMGELDRAYRSTRDVSWVNWRIENDFGDGYRFPRTAWYAGYSSASQPFRWLDSIRKDSDDRPIPVCNGSYTVRPLSAPPGFSGAYWTDPSAPADPDTGFRGCESRNGTLVANQVGPVEPMRPWRSDDPYPQAALNLDALDPTPDPPDPPELENDICRHLVSGQYPNANRLLANPCDEQLALMFRPWMQFDTREHWRPLDIDHFLMERWGSTPLHAVCKLPDVPACTPVTTPSSLSGADEDSYLSINAAFSSPMFPTYRDAEFYKSPNSECLAGERWDCDDGDRSAMYYRPSEPTAKGYRYFDYWTFYRANIFGSDPISNDHNHQGDWEGVSIAPSKRRWGTFDFAAFSQHEGGWKSYLRENLSCRGGDQPPGATSCGTEDSPAGTRVATYVASGSHANYPRPCIEIFLGTCEQEGREGCVPHVPVCIPLPERGRDGAYSWARNEQDDALKKMPDAPGASGFDWSHWLGGWGVPETDGLSGAPKSPGRQNHSWDPTDNECARTDDDCPLEATTARARKGKAKSPRRRSRVARETRECPTWFGSGVQVLACTPKRLKRAVRAQRLNRSGTLRILAPRREGARAARRAFRRARAETAPGLAQRLGAPLKRGTRLRLDGRVPAGTRLFVRLARRHRVYAAKFVVPRAARGAVLRAGGRAGASLRLGGGTVLRPRSVRRTSP